MHVRNPTRYPLYKRSSPDNGGQVSTISMRTGGSRVDQQIDNRRVVPYNKLLLLSMNCHCNVELCMSFKYVLKYVQKGCDQAVFTLQSSQADEILTARMPAMSVAVKQPGGYRNSERSSGSATCCPFGHPFCFFNTLGCNI